jgi:glycine/D-amino acid oxidase-like deaminating enzyme
VTVIDMLSDSEAGQTTPASWAWLNANGKEPKSYQLLNQLGLHAWKCHPELSSLPSWTGSIVRFEKRPAFVDEGGYPVHGPLSKSKIHELEPLAHLPNMKIEDGSIHDETPVYFFPDEGSVDPFQAVKTLRRAAQDLGVQFLTNHNVTKVLRNQDGLVCGIESCPSNSNEGADTTAVTTTPTDLVVVAAGVGAATKVLGALPMLHRPGALAFAKPHGHVQGQQRQRLSRILVDPTRSTHVLQRSDGTIVIGGGVLEVGGSSGSALGNNNADGGDDSPISSADVSLLLLDGARQLAPQMVQDATLTHTTQAVRPMPQDGLPAVGYSEQQGLYMIVTHSGFTLGPLLGALAAGEIVEHVSCDLLAQYRPTRF